MSQVYSLEPPTHGKVVLRTSLGDLDIELWPKEAPKAVRNFVQLCLEGYYDGTVFHRIIKDFMIQGGDPTGTGQGGESIYGQTFKDEFHSRLRFNHRGLVACANQNTPNTNGSQFFITLDRADHMDRNSTIFGKITGDTIYNLNRFNEIEVDEDDRPFEPPTISRTDVLLNPFDDIRPRTTKEERIKAEEAEKARSEAEKKNSRKGLKNFKLISFGEEAEEEDEAEVELVKSMKIKSAHDALEDERLSKEAALEVNLTKVREAMNQAVATKNTTVPLPLDKRRSDVGAEVDNNDDDWAVRIKNRVVAEKQRLAQKRVKPEQDATVKMENDEDDGNDGDDGATLTMKRAKYIEDRTKKAQSAVVAPSRQLQAASLPMHNALLSHWERKRQEYKERKRLTGHREKDTMSKLKMFMEKLSSKKNQGGGDEGTERIVGNGGHEEKVDARGDDVDERAKSSSYDGKIDDTIDHRAYMPASWRLDDYLKSNDQREEEEDDISLGALRGHRLEFVKDRKDANSRQDDVNDYVVVDPLLEAAKAKFNRQQRQQHSKRENN